MTQVQSILESKLNLGAASLLGDGGQGKVYQTSIKLSQPSISLVYKKYKDINQMGFDANVLKAMIAFLHNLDLKQTTELLSICSWPIGLVLDDRSNKPCGFLMPKIPSNFYQLTTNTVAGTKPGNLSEFQYLLNDATIIRKRYSLTLTDADRYLLLHQAAEGLNKLHNYGIAVGDISPKNLLFCLSPSHAIFFLDADAMRFRLSSALIQCETPGWGVREAFNSEELGTPAADCYKLGLLALRLFAGSQVSSDPAQLPSNVSDRFKHIVSETIRNRDLNRPSISEWIKCLANEANNVIQGNLVTKHFPGKAYQPTPVPFSGLTSQSMKQRLLRVSDGIYTSLAHFLQQEPILKIIGSLVLMLLFVFITSKEKPGSQPATAPVDQGDRATIPADETVVTPSETNQSNTTHEAGVTVLRMCNRSGKGTLYAAYAEKSIARYDNTLYEKWTSRGWYSLDLYACIDIGIPAYNSPEGGDVIIYATDNQDTSWTGGSLMCIRRFQGFQTDWIANDSSCSDEYAQVKGSFFIVKPGINTWNFNP